MKKYGLEIAAVFLGVIVGVFSYKRPQDHNNIKPSTRIERQDSYQHKPSAQFLMVRRDSLLLKYNPFSETRSYEVNTKPAGFKDLPDLKSLMGMEPAAELKLLGISETGGERVAYILDQTGKTYAVREGQKIENGYKVVSIYKNKVKLVYDKEEKILKIFDFEVKN